MSEDDLLISSKIEISKENRSVLKNSFFKVMYALLEMQNVVCQEFYWQHIIMAFQNIYLCYNKKVT